MKHLIYILLIIGGIIMIGGIVQGISNLTTGIMNWNQSKKQHKENMQFQRDQFEWQKQQADIQRQREDTAIQRRAADLKQAGFNPYLAENDGAQSTPASGGGFAGDTTDQSLNLGDISGLDPVNIVNSVYNVLRGKNAYESEKSEAVIKRHEAGRQLQLDEQEELNTEYKRLENTKNEKLREEIEERIKEIKARYNTLMHDLNISKREGLRTTDMKDSRYNSVVAAGNQVINTGKDLINATGDVPTKDNNPHLNKDSRRVDEPRKAKGGGYIVDGVWCKDWGEVIELAKKRNIYWDRSHWR